MTTAASAVTLAAADKPIRFALLGDTQIDGDIPERTEWVRWVFEQIAAADPSIVLHVGDVVEHGSLQEYEDYIGTIPISLRDRVHHIPGNHELRWDYTGGERYRKLFGPTNFSIDAGDLHFIGVDPIYLLQGPAGFGKSGVAGVERELERVRPDVPIVVICHLPLGGANYYYTDQERFLELLAAYNVRAVFAGHVHTQRLTRLNGVTQLTVDDTRSSPIYYWGERVDAAKGPVLKMSRMQREPDGTTRTQPVVEIPLTATRPALTERPQKIELRPGPNNLAVSVRLGLDANPAAVRARLYPQGAYGTRAVGDWQELSPDGAGRLYTGDLGIGTLPPGWHRIRVKVSDATGAWYEQTEQFPVPGGPRRRWQLDLGAPVQAGLVAHGELLVAATTNGAVLGACPTPHGLRPRWQAQLGAVYGRPAISADGTTVYVPSVDHRLYALDLVTGRQRFAYDAGAPVLGSPAVTQVGGREVVGAFPILWTHRLCRDLADVCVS